METSEISRKIFHSSSKDPSCESMSFTPSIKSSCFTNSLHSHLLLIFFCVEDQISDLLYRWFKWVVKAVKSIPPIYCETTSFDCKKKMKMRRMSFNAQWQLTSKNVKKGNVQKIYNLLVDDSKMLSFVFFTFYCFFSLNNAHCV